jgi:hypothetical protein
MTIIKDMLLLILVFSITWIGFYLVSRNASLAEKASRYDCNLVYFFSTTPPEVVKECQRQSIENYNKERESGVKQ